MTAETEQLLKDLARRDIILSACGDAVEFDAPRRAMTPELRACVIARTFELLPLLRGPGQWARWASALIPLLASDAERRADLLFRFNERAGVFEFEGNVAREEAERQAFSELGTRVRDVAGGRASIARVHR